MDNGVPLGQVEKAGLIGCLGTDQSETRKHDIDVGMALNIEEGTNLTIDISRF